MSGANNSILILTLHLEPEPNFITTDVAARLARHGRVTVITPFPSYPQGRFYDGRRHWLPHRERLGDLIVWRVPVFPDHSRSKFRRLLFYGTFTAASALLAPLVCWAPSVVWVYQTPTTAALGSLWFKAFFRTKLFYTYADLWPESFIAAGVSKPGALTSFLFALRRWINGFADAIIGSTRGTVQRFLDDGVPAKRLHYVPVWVQGINEAFTPRDARPNRVVYAGNLGAGQHLDPVIRAAAQIRDLRPDIQFDIYGTGLEEEHLRALAASENATNVHFHGRVAPAVAFEASSEALAQIVTLKAEPMFEMTIPSKLPFCFAAGAPVVYSLSGEPARVAAESGAAFPFDSSDPSTLVGTILRIADFSTDERTALRARLRTYYAVEFSRAMLLDRYEVILEGLRGTASAMPVELPT